MYRKRWFDRNEMIYGFALPSCSGLWLRSEDLDLTYFPQHAWRSAYLDSVSLKLSHLLLLLSFLCDLIINCRSRRQTSSLSKSWYFHWFIAGVQVKAGKGGPQKVWGASNTSVLVSWPTNWHFLLALLRQVQIVIKEMPASALVEDFVA